MDRQAKLKGLGDERFWRSFGVVTFLDAAKKLAELLEIDEPADIQVRDAGQPNVVHEFTVVRQVEYVVTNPRQGAE